MSEVWCSSSCRAGGKQSLELFSTLELALLKPRVQEVSFFPHFVMILLCRQQNGWLRLGHCKA